MVEDDDGDFAATIQGLPPPARDLDLPQPDEGGTGGEEGVSVRNSAQHDDGSAEGQQDESAGTQEDESAGTQEDESAGIQDESAGRQEDESAGLQDESAEAQSATGLLSSSSSGSDCDPRDDCNEISRCPSKHVIVDTGLDQPDHPLPPNVNTWAGCWHRTTQVYMAAMGWYWERPYLRLSWMLATTAANQVFIVLAILHFKMEHNLVFQALGLVFHAAPYLVVSGFCCKTLHDLHDWHVLEAMVAFLVAPYAMLMSTIVYSVRHLQRRFQRRTRRPRRRGERRMASLEAQLGAVTSLASLWGLLAAAPQVYLQITAAHASPEKDLYLMVSINISLLKASVAQMGHLTINWWWKLFGVGAVMGSMGSRAWLVASLYTLPGWWRYICLAPVTMSFLVAWLARCARLGTALADPLHALRNALVLPPIDAESLCGLIPYILAGIGMAQVRPLSATILLGALGACNYGGSWLWRAMMAMQRMEDDEKQQELEEQELEEQQPGGCGVEEPCTYQ